MALEEGEMSSAGLVYSHMSLVSSSRADGRTHIYRRRGECYAPNCMQQRGRFGCGNVMAW